MKLQIVAVKDRALDTFMRPFYVPALGAAIRSFGDEINRVEGEMYKHPDDFDLFHLGTWDDNTGEFQNLGMPMQIAIGKQFSDHQK